MTFALSGSPAGDVSSGMARSVMLASMMGSPRRNARRNRRRAHGGSRAAPWSRGIPCGSEFAGNSAFFGKIGAEKAFDLRTLRQNSLRGRAGNFFAPSREYAENFSSEQGIFAPTPKSTVTGIKTGCFSFSVPSGGNAREEMKDSRILRKNSLRGGTGNDYQGA